MTRIDRLSGLMLFALAANLVAAPATPTPSSAKLAEKILRIEEKPSGSLLQFLTHELIRKELKLTADQEKLIEDALEESKRQHRERIEEINRQIQAQLGGANIAPGGIKIGGFGGPISGNIPAESEQTSKLVASLKPEQILRLKQLDFQSRGPAAFLDRKVIRHLQLSESQEDRLDAISKDYMKQRLAEIGKPIIVDMVGNGANNAEMDALAKQCEQAIANCRKILTPQQLATWDEILGNAMPMNKLLPIANSAARTPGMPQAGTIIRKGIGGPGVIAPALPAKE